MPDEIIIEPVKYHEPLRKVLNDVFKNAGDLPIKGGWGYNKEEAIVIDKNDPVVDPGFPFDGVGMEYMIAELLIYLELIVFRKQEDRFSGIKTKLNTQSLHSDNGRHFDVLVFDVTAFRDKDFAMLKEEWMTNENNPGFDVQKHIEKMEKLKCHYKRELWFDITSFYGQF